MTHDAVLPRGLTEADAARHLALHGPNVVSVRGRRPAILDYLFRFRNPLVIVLVASSAVLGWSGDVTGMSIILLMVVASVSLDFFQEHRAERAVERLQSTLAARATVMRDGIRRVVPASTLVPGDVVLLNAGSIVPADGHVVAADRLFVNESALTGESFPVEKSPDGASHDVHMGTAVISGTGTFVVHATGASTYVASVSADLAAPRGEVPLERGIRQFGTMILRVTILLVLVVVLACAVVGRPWLESFLFAVALAVGLTPELLPMVVSVTLARGALRLARREIIVKRPSAVYALGSIDVLCTDKTGTLTEAAIHVAGSEDALGTSDDTVRALASVNSALSSGVRSPLDEALGAQAQAAAAYRKLDEVAFDFKRRIATVLVARADDDRRLLIAKGAPEDVLAHCSSYVVPGSHAFAPITAPLRVAALARFASLGEQGLRVLAVAVRDMPQGCARIDEDDGDRLAFAGFVTFYDPPKLDAARALADLAHAGIAIKILTGDHESVARHVCAAIGLRVDGALDGAHVDAMDDEALAVAAGSANLFCRLTPGHKTRLIAALRRGGRTVGFMGDGINDAPALHAADVGISVDGAVDVAREAADVILTRAQLTVVRDGVLEGRRTYANIMKYLMMVTSSNFGNMLSMAAAAAFLPFLPMLPVQILLNNLLYDFSEIAIPFDHVDASELRRPHAFDIHEIRRFMLVLGPASSVFDLLTFAFLLSLGASQAQFQTGWFVESIATQVLVIFVIRTRLNPVKAGAHPLLVAMTVGAVSAAVLLTFTPAAAWFGFVALPGAYFATIAALVVAYLMLAEWCKRHVYRIHGARRHRHASARRTAPA